MRKAFIASLIVFLMCAAALVPATHVAAKTEGRPMLTDDGLYWADDKRVTNNPSPDTSPQLTVDSRGDTHVIWTRGSDYMYTKLDYMGATILQERIIATATFPTQHSGQLGKTIGIDGSENIHIIYKEGGSWYGNVMYEKYNSGGKQLIQPMDVSSGLQMSMGANMAVAKNDNVYIIYDYYPPGGTEREGVTIINPQGQVIKQAVDVSEPSWYIEGATLTVDWENKLRSLQNVWHGADQGMWATTLDKYGVRPTDTPPQHLYTTSSYGFPPMPAMTACPDNTVHILRSSADKGGGTLTYMKLDGKNRAVAGHNKDIIVTESAADYSDIGCDSRNNVYLIWADNGDGKLYYYKMEPGTENKTIKAVKLTTQGTARDPKLALDPNDNLHVVWKDDRNGNDEIYYKFAFNFGVELGLSPEETAKLMFIHPEEVKTGNLTVKNLGGQNDTIWLNISIEFNGLEENGWDAWLEEDEFELGPQEVKKITVSVLGPVTGEKNDNIEVFINASSKGNPWKNDTVSFKVFLIVDSRIEISCADNVHMTGAGESTEFVIAVNNVGDLPEDIVLEAEGPADWDFDLSVYEVFLTAKQGTVIRLTVTPPHNALADEIGMVKVMGQSIDKAYVKDNAITHTVVSPTMFIDLEVDDPENYVDPGNATDFVIKISNTGNMPGIVVIVLEIVSGTGDWVAFLDRNSVGLPANGEDSVKLTVQAPPDALANQRLVVKVEGYNDARTQKDSVQATAIVNQVHELQVTAAPDKVTVNPGGTAMYEVTVSNNGNGIERLRLEESIVPVGWELFYAADGSSLDEVWIDPGASVSFSVEVRVPTSELAGIYDIAGRLSDDRGNKWDIPLKTIVNQMYAIDITTTLSKQMGSPGKVVFFTILARNLGNGPDTISLEINGLPLDWRADFVYDDVQTDSVLLEAREEGRVSLLVTIPYTTVEDAMDFTVIGTSSAGLQDDIALVIDIEMSNLEITKIRYRPSVIKANKPVTIEVMVMNVGKVDLENVTVRFYEGNTPSGVQTLERFAGNTNKTVVFTWVPPTAGDFKLKYIVDPDDQIMETDESDNEKPDKVIVRESGSLLPGFEGILLVMAMVAVAVVVVRRRK